MKRPAQYARRTFIAAALIATLLPGCEQPQVPQPPAAPTFVGKWKTAGKIAILKADGTLLLRDNVPFLSTDPKDAIREYSGKYEVNSDGNLVIQIDGGPIPNGEYETTLTEDTFVISIWNGPKGRSWFWDRIDD